MSKAYISNIFTKMENKNIQEEKVFKTILPEKIIFIRPSTSKKLNQTSDYPPKEPIKENKIEEKYEMKSEIPENIKIEKSIEKQQNTEIKKINLKFVTNSEFKKETTRITTRIKLKTPHVGERLARTALLNSKSIKYSRQC